MTAKTLKQNRDGYVRHMLEQIEKGEIEYYD